MHIKVNEQENITQLEDMIEAGDQPLSISLIETLSKDRATCQRYEQKFKQHLYTSLLMSLTHESFEEDDARELWQGILKHRQSLNSCLGRDVGISVACLDYLFNIEHRLKEPIIIEEDKSDFITEATTRDELTDLYLRSVFDVMLKKELDESLRNQSGLCLLMIDIDDFKLVNDNFGHLKGDEVLKCIGELLNHSVREMDLAARYGGEEMAVIMPRSNIQQASQVAERIRQKVQQQEFDEFEVTVSIGVSQISPEMKHPDELIEKADNAMYSAKDRGKNCVVLSEE